MVLIQFSIASAGNNVPGAPSSTPLPSAPTTTPAAPPQPSAAPLPGGGYPPTNPAGQRICRQCGMAGRYKEGKCVEKWGPGPEGPGTVCDRCRKKMKRVERRGTLDASQASVVMHSSMRQAQSQTQSQSQSMNQSQSQRTTPPQRQDTVIVADLPPPPSSSARDRGAGQTALGRGGREVSPAPRAQV